jgi:glycine cleavage system transcriptional repressor
MTKLKSHSILVASGADRPGVLDELSLFLFERGGNIEDSRVINLDARFALLARIGAADDAMAKIKQDLGELAHSSGIHLELHPIIPGAQRFGDTFPFRFTARGRDQAGVLHRISHLLRVLNINIDDVKTKVAAEPEEQNNGAPFELMLMLAVPRETPITMLRDYLNHLCGEMKIEWSLDPV